MAKDSPKRPYHKRTQLIHGRFRSKKWDYDHHVVPPMSASATFRLEAASRGAAGFFQFACDQVNPEREVPIYIYDRLDEPTRGMLEENLATAEGADCGITFATGMAAISAALGVLCGQGDEIVAHRVLYGCTYSLLINWLPRLGVHTRFVDLNDRAALASALGPRTRVVYCESPVNPTLELIDLRAVRGALGDDPKRPLLVIDNTFATPHCQRPLELGADVVVHSLTKGIGGFGTDMGGAVLAPDSLRNLLLMYRKDFGGVLSPRAAWDFLVHGLPTLATRMDNAQKSALKLARWLEKHPKVERVVHPGLESFPQAELARKQMIDPRGRFAPGSMIYFEVKDPLGDGGPGARLIDWVAAEAYTITLAVSLGQVKTLIEHPYSMTHSVMSEEDKRAGGMHPGGIRLSVGLEDVDDIQHDLSEALARA
jgi:cystathionine beta-lyase/cystathionine gamma-synthase